MNDNDGDDLMDDSGSEDEDYEDPDIEINDADDMFDGDGDSELDEADFNEGPTIDPEQIKFIDACIAGDLNYIAQCT